MDKSKIPHGVYCYEDGGCPYQNKHHNMKVSFSGYYCSVTECCYLKVNSMSLMLEGKAFEAWLLTDDCKLCGEKIKKQL